MKLSLPAASALLALSLVTGAAPAQEIQLTGPIGGRPWIWNRPERIEWSQWFAAGGGTHLPAGREGRDGVFGVGVEATVRLRMFPTKNFRYDDFELRGGGWASAVTDGRGMRGEGGVMALYGCAGPDRLLVPALRLGAGWGSDGLGRAPHLVATFTLGFRAAAERRWPRHRRRLAFVSGLRLFVTTRGGLAREAIYQVTSGIELDPAFFSPLAWGGQVLGAGR